MRYFTQSTRDPIFLCLIFLILGCGQGGGCGGLAPADSFGEKDKIEIAGQIRITRNGLSFFEENLEPILASALPEGGLDICVPRQGDDIDIETLIGDFRIGSWSICGEEACPDGGLGCPLNIAIGAVDLVIEEPNRVEAQIEFSELSATIPIAAEPFVECSVSIDGPGFELSLPIHLDTPDPTRFLAIELAGQPVYALSDLTIRLQGEGGLLSPICDAFDEVINLPFIGDLILGAIQDLLDGALYDQLKRLFERFTCRSCDVLADCRDFRAAACVDGLCTDRNEACIVEPLGINGRIDLAELLGGLLMTPSAPVDILAVPGSFVEVEREGLSMGLIAGFKSPRDRCVPPMVPPEVDSIEPSALLRGGMIGQEEDFQIGFGITRAAVDRLMWASYNAGILCVQATGATISQLNTSLLGVIFPDLASLARNPRAPVAITLSPQNPPNVTFGTNTITLDGEGNPMVVDPLLTIEIEELWFDFHVFMDDRWVRFASLHANLNLPFAIDFTSRNTLIPILGELSQSLQDLRLENSNLLRGDNELVVTLLPMLINVFAGGLVTDLIEPIALPPILGFELDLEDTRFTGIENGEMLAIFTNLQSAEFATISQVETQARVVEIHMPDYAHLPQYGIEAWRSVWVDVEVSAFDSLLEQNAFEVSYQVDGLAWSPFQPIGTVRVRSPQFLLQGHHELRFRARRVGDYQSLDFDGVTLPVIIDNIAPELRLSRNGEWVQLTTSDLVTAPESLVINVHGPNGLLRRLEHNRFKVLDDGLYTVFVTDEAGNTASKSLDVHQNALIGRPPPSARDDGGCACSTTEPSHPLPLFVLALLLGLRIKRGRFMMMTLLVSVFALSGCSDESAAKRDVAIADAGVPTCFDSADCINENEVCRVGVCARLDCTSDTECELLACLNGVGLCNPSNQCLCVPNCDSMCDESEYCCQQSNECRDLAQGCDAVCPPGFERDAALIVSNVFECTVDQSSCTCSELPPLDSGLIGRYANLATDGQQIYVSAYAEAYGDLVVGVASEDGALNWMWVDGVPEGAEVVAAPSGPRGGVESAGLDVGMYTSIAVDQRGAIHVAYYGPDPGSLYYAYGQPNNEVYDWSSILLDEAGDAGRWTSISLDLDGNPGIAYHVRYLNGVSQLRYLFATHSQPTSRSDWATPFLLQARPIDMPGDNATETYPEGTGLFTSQARDREGLPTVAWYDRSEGKLWMSRFNDVGFLPPEMIAGWGHADSELDGDMGANVHVALDANGEPHLCFQDGNTDSLRYVAPTLNRSEWVDDGVWIDTGGRSQSVHIVGEDCQILFDDAGQPVLVYQDATQQSLLMRRRNQSDQNGDFVWSGRQELRRDLSGTPRGYGFYASAVILDGILWVGHLTYDRDESSEGYFELISIPL